MERQISSRPVPYVLEQDRGEPEEEQVVFWIRPLKGDGAADIIVNYDKVRRPGRRGERGDLSGSKLKQAEHKLWIQAVAKVDNYPPSEDYKRLLELCDKDGRIPSVETEEDLILIYRDLMPDQAQEVIDARADSNKLKVPEKKV